MYEPFELAVLPIFDAVAIDASAPETTVEVVVAAGLLETMTSDFPWATFVGTGAVFLTANCDLNAAIAVEGFCFGS